MSTPAIETPVDQPPGTTPVYGIEYPMPNSYVRREQLENLANQVEEALIAATAAGVTPEQKAVIDQLRAPGASDLVWQVGNGTDSSFTFTHNLNSRRYYAEVTLRNAPYEVHSPDVYKPTPNTVRLDFGTYVPSANEYDLVLVPLTVIHGPGEDNLTAEMVAFALDQVLASYTPTITAATTAANNAATATNNALTALNVTVPDLADAAAFMHMGA